MTAVAPLLSAIDAVLVAEARVRTDRDLAATRRLLVRRVGHVFGVQRAGVLRRLRALEPTSPVLTEAARAEDWDALLSAVFQGTRRLLERAIGAAARSALRLGATATLRDLGLETSFTLANPRAVAFLAQHGADRVTLIDETTRAELRAILVQAAAEGWAYSRTARVIGDRFTEMRVGRPQEHVRSRAALIAVTEIGEAYSHGNLLAAREVHDAGTPMEKSWLTAADSRVSDLCRGNAEAGWIPIEDAFPSGHDRPLGHPACRCALLTRAVGS